MNTPVDPKAAEAAATPAATQLAVIPERRQEVRVVTDVIPVLDTARFEHMQRVANVMVHSNLVPDALCKVKEGSGDSARMVPLDPMEIVSNCFLVVNQAVRWGMDPFAVAQCVSVVHGKLCYEGKLIAAIIDAKLGIRLRYEWSGQNDAMKIKVSGTFADGTTESIEGTVSEWKTTGSGSPWKPAQYRKMLAYRGAREWARLYAPGLMLGVYSPDEMDSLSDDSRSTRARDVTARALDDDMPPAPPPRQIAQQDAPPTSPAGNTAATATTTPPAEPPVDTSFVELATSTGAQTTPPEDDNPPDPASRPAEQSRAAETGKTSPADPLSPPATPAGEVPPSSADQLITSLQATKSVHELEAWLDQYGRDMADLEGPDQRRVETAYNNHEGALRSQKKK